MTNYYYDDPLAAAWLFLPTGEKVIFDYADLDKIEPHSWSATRNKTNHVYARTAIWGINGKKKQKHIRMHRLIMNAPTGVHVDHINGNTLDNRKQNLRFCDDRNNQRNAKSRAASSSKYKGVSWHIRDKKWVAQIRLENGLKYLESFKEEDEAADAYNNAAILFFGEFARLNIIQRDSKPFFMPKVDNAKH